MSMTAGAGWLCHLLVLLLLLLKILLVAAPCLLSALLLEVLLLLLVVLPQTHVSLYEQLLHLEHPPLLHSIFQGCLPLWHAAAATQPAFVAAAAVAAGGFQG
jgi:hypothetical protein